MTTNYFTIVEGETYLTKRAQLYGVKSHEVELDEIISFKLTDVSVSLVNAIRRISMNEIETIAIDPSQIEWLINKSQYHQDVLSQRFGLITINSEYFMGVGSELHDPENYQFSLCDPQDPNKPLTNNTNLWIPIYIHQHLKIYRNDELLTFEEIKQICPYNSLLLYLNPNESIHAHMKIIRGTGRQHARWQSGITMYKMMTMRDEKGDPDLSLEDQYNYLKNAQDQPQTFMLTINSIGKWSATDILQLSLSQLIQKLSQLKEKLHLIIQKKETNSVSIEEDTNHNLIKLIIKEEDHTLGHLLETIFLKQLREILQIQQIDEITKTQALYQSLSSYRVPHPLSDEIELLFKTPTIELILPTDGSEEDQIESLPLRILLLAMNQTINLCHTILQQIEKTLGQYQYTGDRKSTLEQHGSGRKPIILPKTEEIILLENEYLNWSQSQKQCDFIIQGMSSKNAYETKAILERWHLANSNYVKDKSQLRQHEVTIKMRSELLDKRLISIKTIDQLLDQLLAITPDPVPNNVEPKIIRHNGVSVIQYGKFAREFPTPRVSLLETLANSHHLIATALRYASLISGGQQWSVPANTYQLLVTKYGVTLEAFASPFNSQMIRLKAELNNPNLEFCSLFPELDQPYGSIGNFFDVDVNRLIRCNSVINPPFIEQILNQVVEKCLATCDLANKEKKGTRMFVVVPMWTDARFYQNLDQSPCLETKLIHEAKKYFYENPNDLNKHIPAPAGTIFILSAGGLPKIGDYSDISKSMEFTQH